LAQATQGHANGDGPSPMLVAVAGALVLVTVMGIGRFAYTPLLPRLRDALGLGIAAAGDIATANFVGYLLGALLSGPLAARPGRMRWLYAALLLSTLTTAAGVVPWSWPLWLALRFAAGFASALGVVIGTALVLDYIAVAGRPRLVTLHFPGVGIGIVLSVLLIEAARLGGLSVFGQWGVLGVAAGLASAFAISVLRRLPDPPARAPGARAAPMLVSGELKRVIAAYGLLGFGYVITATFLVAMARELDNAAWLEPLSWIVVGATAAPSVPLVQKLAARFGMFPVMRAAFCVEAAGVLLAGYGEGTAAVLIGAACVGGTFLSITALVLGAARALGGAHADGLLGWMTAAFGFGQLLGPALAGRLAEVASGFGPPSLLAALALGAAALLLPGRDASARR
jgi:predicted MFS family arabinose efflux permease